MDLTTLARRLACAAGLLLSLTGAATAQGDWPNKPVRIIAIFAPGGSSDLVARQIAQHLSTRFGQQFIVENRVGAGGNIGVDHVAKSPPDGYTLAMATSGPLANNKSLYNPMPFDPEKDLTPIALVGEIPLVLAVNPSVKASTLGEFIAQSKSAPNALTVANPGKGTIGHLATESLRLNSAARLSSVPYKGDAPAMTDAMTGSVEGVSAPVTSLLANIQGQKLKALAVTSKARFPGLPNVPTALEQGVNLEATVWNALVGPAGVPRSIVTALNQEINKYTASAEGKAKLASLGVVPLAGTPAQLSELMASEAAKWKRVVEAAKISID
ncbi:Bug family tripartite tricarboxylate transporter substrate binding protein [Aquabacterium sp. J223]|uniref:Bug family tripartite tricarboxylate transporter substrate binding protein n=1 Tax=Aquabacterium sp. J223 TaxID=2898431 RepID=UPI0021AE16B5|nr:tripartite tricarboxylate transporter substrate binding protein [Aquabacterium sp. J223]UUX96692.1 tripartite tricarboxylate transporter substrate binding protein [Aquabacterium sp. J223]